MQQQNYFTLNYLNSLGWEPEELAQAGQYSAIRRLTNTLTDYELIYYSSKLLKMPLSTYNKEGIKWLVYHNTIAEAEQKAREQEQTRAQQKAKEQQEKARKEAIFKGFLIFGCCVWVLVLLLCLACFVLLR